MDFTPMRDRSPRIFGTVSKKSSNTGRIKVNAMSDRDCNLNINLEDLYHSSPAMSMEEFLNSEFSKTSVICQYRHTETAVVRK